MIQTGRNNVYCKVVLCLESGGGERKGQGSPTEDGKIINRLYYYHNFIICKSMYKAIEFKNALFLNCNLI